MHFKKVQDDIELEIMNRESPENGRDTLIPLLSTHTAVRSFDCILVAPLLKDQNDQKYKKQEAYISDLQLKNLKVTKVHHDNKIFYGVRAPEELFDKYKYLLKVSDSCNWSAENGDCVQNTTRIRIVYFILHHTFIGTGEGLRDLMNQEVFETLFCLHERTQQEYLKRKWASWKALKHLVNQPVDDIRDYFGEKIALYFLWLGWYTRMLIPAAVIGIVVFLYALAFFDSNPIIKEVCESNITMCPICDKRCHMWKLSDTCFYAKLSHLFDNEGTVAFAMFMAVWATLFLELWKRHRSLNVSRWSVFDWCEDEEELILEIVNNPHCKPKEYKHSYIQSILVLLLFTMVLVVIIGLAHALVICRVVSAMLLSDTEWKVVSNNANMIAVTLGAVLHYLTIQVMTRVNRFVAFKLCALEKTRSFAATERSFTVKMFTFQFFTLFSSLIYVAFFLGRINGYPGNYVRIAGKWRLEECHPSGCLTDLFIQMAIILILKQTISNIFEFAGPWLKLRFKRAIFNKDLEKCGDCKTPTCKEDGPGIELCDVCNLKEWLRNYHLNTVHAFSLFNEFLEMVIQFSFTTIFVAAFPLAPLLALANNIFEIRLDAIKMLRMERRLVPKKTNDIGVWTRVLEVIGVAAVIANGLVIGISSEFVPRLIYRYRFGPCANGTATDLQCLAGYTDYTLTTAYMSNANVRKDFSPEQMMHGGMNVTQCSYKAYRTENDQSFTSHYWFIIAARFAFVILFEHVLLVCKFIVAWYVPDNPMRVKNNRLHDKLKRLKEELQELSAQYDNRTTDV
ncbi:anoctamin-9 isoform X1 [Tachysurus fulvidraco]|uniref:anoctamin-9 isoform X1 n=1 Tax=Tachysurus fulvidraco TaxID=1234273 RepID=UPI000F4E5104|nr:anoctamin-9 isoform X1 [Tachysurus fulvidraco]